jgi:hypothetical protein
MAMSGSDEPAETSDAGLVPGRALRLIVMCGVLLAVAIRLYLIFATRATEEDFYITLRYAWNLAHGFGLVYNPGERVLGTTTPLYTLLLAFLIRLGIDPVLGGKLTAVAADALSCWFVWRLGCLHRRCIAGLCAALCLAIAPLNLTESVKGMESSLVACACIGAWTFWAMDRERESWLCAALATLLRIDAVVLAAILFAASLRRDRRPPWSGLLVFGLATVPWLAYAALVFGTPVPASLRAKLIVYGWHSTTPLPNLVPFLRIMTHNPLSVLLAAGAVLAAAMAVSQLLRRSTAADSERSDRPKDLSSAAPVRQATIVPMLAWLLLYYAGMAFSKVFLFGWYFLPPTPVYYLIAFLGWDWLIRVLAGRPGSVRAGLRPTTTAALCLVVAAGLAVVTVPRVARTLRESQRVEDELRIPIGLWLRGRAAPRDTVMLEPIGYIGYYSGLRVLDTVGLVSPQVLPEYRADERSPYHAIWTRFRPEWILLRAGEWEDLRHDELALPAEERLGAHYDLVRTWSGAGPDSEPVFFLFAARGEQPR